MPKQQQNLTLNFPAAMAVRACEQAIASLGWRMTGQTPTGLACVEVSPEVGVFAWPVNVDIALSGGQDPPTAVTMFGSNSGWGPIQSNHLRKQMGLLVARIQQEAARSPANPQMQGAANQFSPQSQPLPQGVGSQSASSRSIIVNDQRVTDQQVQALEQAYRTRIPDGNYWYHKVSGAWGLRGGPTSGYMVPSMNLGGPLRADASNGDTGVFVNGRQLQLVEVLILMKIYGQVNRGRIWLDGQGNWGAEGGPMMDNVIAASRRAGLGGGGRDAGSQFGSVMSDGEGFIGFIDSEGRSAYSG